MSSTSPPPNSTAPPPTSTSPPPRPSSPPPPLNSPPPQLPAALPPQANSPPPQPPPAPPPQPNSPPPDPRSAPPPQMNSPPPAIVTSPPPVASPPPPPVNALPPVFNAPPPPVNALPPVVNTPPLPVSPPPASPPPPPLPASPPPLTNSPPPPSRPPNNAPPPPTTPTPRSSPPPRPPPNSSPPPPPPPPSLNPPRSSPPPRPPPNSSPPPPPPPPPSLNPPRSSPPPPSTEPPLNSPPPPVVSPPATPQVPSRPPPPSLPPTTSPPRSPPPPSITTSPPPPSTVPSPPGPLLSPPPPSLDPTTNNRSNTIPDHNAPEISGPPSSGGLGTGGTVAIAVAVSLLLLGLFGIAACCIWKRKKKASGHNGGYIMPTSIASSPRSDSGLLKVQISSPNNGSGSSNGVPYSPHDPGGLGNSRSWFTYEELDEATDRFSAQNLLGQGGFGSVYKGNLVDGREVAVKQLKSGGGQGEREFRSEVEIISRIHHRHLVSLVGYCISGERRLLVYDYLPNNTLYFHLHGQGQPVLDWAARVKIAVGAARGIAYLHEDCHPRVIHRDIKSSNILLDSNFEARVSDFGLAKLAMDANTHVTTRVMGTFGYMAPEYANSGKLTEKSDVFSYGVVLLELITGRKPVDTAQPLGDESLVEWARPLLSHALETGDFKELADPRLDGNFTEGEMFRLIEAAAACVRHSSAKRPTMGQVVRAFDNMAVSDLTNGMKVGESEIFNSAQQSEEIRFFRRMAFGSHVYSTDFFSQNSSSSEGNRENSRRI